MFLDLKKAFDTVSLPILVQKLEAIGIRGIPLELLRSYLTDRKQRVKLEHHISEDADVSYGVPQGSVLGPTLFLVYINDLCKLRTENAKLYAYADDTAVIFHGKTWNDVKEVAEKGMSLVCKWLDNNLLTLNTAKTKYICYSMNSRGQHRGNFDVMVHKCILDSGRICDCPKLDKVTHTKYLGVIIDCNLSWYPHLEHVATRLRKLSWIFKTLRHVVPPVVTNPKNPDSTKNILNEIYIALAQSVIIYCIPIWGGAAKTKFLDLERVQRSLIKVMYFKKRRYPTGMLYQESNLLSIRKLYILQTLLKKHKDLPYDPKIKTKRRYDLAAKTISTRTKFARTQYSAQSSFLYNKINKEIDIYEENYYECKKNVTKWLNALEYDEVEALLEHIK